jgi:hypothetical protein
MRIGTACANGGRGAAAGADTGLAGGRACQAGSTVVSDLEHCTNKTVGESRVLDADLIDEMRSRTACHDELTCAAALFSGSKL